MHQGQLRYLPLHSDERTNVVSSKSINSSNGYSVDSQPNGASFLVASALLPCQQRFLKITPVYVKSILKSLLMHGFLDHGFNTSLSATRLFNILEVTGVQTTFSVSTIREGWYFEMTKR